MSLSLRGGAHWNANQYSARCAVRNWGPPKFQHSDLGFRIAKKEHSPVLRGGPRRYSNDVVHITYRFGTNSTQRFGYLSFRVARRTP